jgi:hypothetical protein
MRSSRPFSCREKSRSMTRRRWLLAAPVAAGAAALAFDKQRKTPSLMNMTPANGPLVAGCQVGFRPDSRKQLLIRNPQWGTRVELLITSAHAPPRTFSVETRGPSVFDNAVGLVSLNDLKAEGSYFGQVLLDEKPAGAPFPFVISRDAWSRLLPMLAGYAHLQRCGSSDRIEHPICHRDDARRSDTGKHTDVTGGWHDAGDLRKWVDSTLMNLFGLTALARSSGIHSDSGPSSIGALLDETRYGNGFFLKMQDSDGLIWADVGGGNHGDNSDNHWTDNTAGTNDDRWINVEKKPGIQSMFIAAQAIMHTLFAKSDPAYAARCLDAALFCWRTSSSHGDRTVDLAWRTLAAVELFVATGRPELRREVIALAGLLTSLQFSRPVGGSTAIRGFFPMWRGGSEPLRDPVHSTIPLLALLHAAATVDGSHPDEAKSWRKAVRIYLDEYLIPMTAFSPYGIAPFGLFRDIPPAQRDVERYRPLSSEYSYRFFMPVKTPVAYLGLSSHLLSHATLFSAAERCFGESKYRAMAYSHLEWIFGANPFGASLVTGIGFNQPPPFSPFVGAIRGGIMNGIAGNEDDQPVLDLLNATEWRTNEYWSPHSGYCQWALSLLEAPRG